MVLSLFIGLFSRPSKPSNLAFLPFPEPFQAPKIGFLAFSRAFPSPQEPLPSPQNWLFGLFQSPSLSVSLSGSLSGSFLAVYLRPQAPNPKHQNLKPYLSSPTCSNPPQACTSLAYASSPGSHRDGCDSACNPVSALHPAWK